ncbi:hypothetical protein ACNKHU_19295 [Shigella flexneri]
MLSNRMTLGVFFGQYFINTITCLFLTCFPIYLVQEKGMSILKWVSSPRFQHCVVFAGGVLGGVFSNYPITRLSPTLARKLPIVLGMLLASTIILCKLHQHHAGGHADGAGSSLAKDLVRWAGR